MSTFFRESLKNATVKTLKNCCVEIEKVLSLYEDNEEISALSIEDFISLINSSERISLASRAGCEEAERNLGSFYDPDYERLCLKDLPCKMDFDGETFVLSTPYTIKRAESKSKIFQKENYEFLNYVHAEIARWSEENPEVKLKFNDNFTGGRLVMITARYAKKFNKSVHCDHDNLENGRVQNAVCSALGISDSANNMDYLSIFRLCDNEADEGTKFIVTSREKLSEFV